MSTLTFSVIDVQCEANDQTFFPPRVSLATQSVTTIATLYGFTGPGNPPTKWLASTWSGTSTWQLSVYNYQLSPGGVPPLIPQPDNGNPCGAAQFTYGGADTCDNKGNILTRHYKTLTASCPLPSPILSNQGAPIGDHPNCIEQAVGFCYPTDPASCPTCSTTDPTGFSIPDFSSLGTSYSCQTGINATNDYSFGSGLYAMMGLTNYPISWWIDTNPESIYFGIPFGRAFVNAVATNTFGYVLSNQFTDEMALADAQVITGSGATAENVPRTTGFVSTFTTVNFHLNLSNLIYGKSYIASVNFQNNVSGITVKNYPFTATASTQVISDSVPLPPAFQNTTVRSPSVIFAS